RRVLCPQRKPGGGLAALSRTCIGLLRDTDAPGIENIAHRHIAARTDIYCAIAGHERSAGIDRNGVGLQRIDGPRICRSIVAKVGTIQASEVAGCNADVAAQINELIAAVTDVTPRFHGQRSTTGLHEATISHDTAAAADRNLESGITD